MKRVGTVLVFKKGTTKAQAQAILDNIKQHLGTDIWIQYDKKPNGETDYSKYHPVAFIVEEFEEEHGTPAWYIP